MTFLQDSFRVSERRACAVLIFKRSSHRYHSNADGQAELRMRIKEIAAVRVRYGYKRIHVLLLREGWEINHKRVYRIYCEEGLNLRRKRSKKHKREPLGNPGEHSECQRLLGYGLCVRQYFSREAFSHFDYCRYI